MKFGRLCLPIFIAGLISAVYAQGPLFDKVVVDFPHDTRIGDQVIPSGHYDLQQLRDSGDGSHIIVVLKNRGRNYQASAISIPALRNNTPDATRLMIRRVGSDYYLDTIWIAGKDYGYQFPLPQEAKANEPQTASLSLNYQAPPPPVAAAPPPPPPPRQEKEVAQAPPPPPPPAREPEAAPAPPPPPPQAPPPAHLPQTASEWATIGVLGVASLGLGVILKLRRRGA